MKDRFDLPPALADQVRALAGRHRSLRLLSRLPLLFFFLGVFPLLLFLVDRLLPLSLTALRLGLAVYLAVAGALTLRLALFLRSRLREEDLSLAAEQAFPDLAERFSTVVSLSSRSGASQDNPQVRDALADQAVAGTRNLDLRAGLPLGPAWKRMLPAAGLLAAVLVCPLVFPSARVFGLRLFRSWHDPYHGYALYLDPGTRHFAQGQPVPFKVRLELLDEVTVPPEECRLLFEEGSESRILALTTRDGCEFTGTLPSLERDVVYRAEAGDLRTDSHELTAVPPLRLAPGFPKVAMNGPAYVPQADRLLAVQGGSYAAWEFGVLQLDLGFERPVQGLRCRFEWEAGPDRPKLVRTVVPSLDAGRAGGKAQLVLEREGSVRGHLEVEAEGGVVFRWPLPEFHVRRDQPPEFLRVDQALVRPGSAVPAEAAPDDVLRFSVAVRDDSGLERVDLEYRIDEGPIAKVPLLTNGKTAEFRIDSLFPLEGKVKPEQKIQFRFRALDNRRLAEGSIRVDAGSAFPAADLPPQETIFPPGRDESSAWMPLRIVPRQTPLEERHILARRDGIEKRLREILKSLVMARAQVQKARLAGHQQAALDGNVRRDVEAAQKSTQAIGQDLAEVAEMAAADPGWQELASRVLEIAQGEMARSAEALQAGSQPRLNPEQREGHFRRGENELEQASRKVTALLQLNQELAQARLDEFRLDDLGRREQELAGKTDDEKKAGKLADQHQGLMDRLAKMLQDSPVLRAAQEELERARMEKAAAELDRLVKEQAALQPKAEPELSPALKNRLQDLARKQKELAGKVEDWRKDSSSRPEAHRSALDAAAELDRARPQPALMLQDQAAAELDRQGERLEKPIPPQSLRQGLARMLQMQETLHKDLEQLGHDFPRLSLEEAKKRLRDIAEKQKTLAKDMAQLQTTVENRQRPNLAQASNLLEMTAKDLFTRPALNGFLRMEEAMQALRESLARVPDEPAEPAPGDPKAQERRAEQAKQARALAAAQRNLRDEVRKALAEGLPRPAAEDIARQEQLRDQMENVLKDLQQAAGKKTAGPQDSSLKEAVAALQQAKDMLAKAAGAGKEPGKGQALAKEAARMLEQAGKKVKEAAGALAMKQAKGKDTPGAPEAVKMVRQGQEAMAQAQKMLQGKTPAQAGKAMNQAATALRQAARQIRTKMAGGAKRLPTVAGDPAGTMPSRNEEEGRLLPPFRLDAKKGSVWGDLPGELKTRLLLDVQQRYGEDYGPIIQRYFRRLAEPIADERRK